MRLMTDYKGGKPASYIARVSYSDDDSFGALWDSERRGVPIFAPRGFRYRPCEDDSLLMLGGEGGELCAGVLCRPDGLAPGETELCGPGGGSILMKRNGDIVLNGVVITKNGEIIPKGGV